VQIIQEYIKENSEKYRSYRGFLRGISTNSTKELYAKFMKNFMEFHKLENYDDVAKFETKKIDELLEDHIDSLDSRGVKGVTVRTNMAGIERFFDMNDCIWHKSRIRRSIKRDTGIKGGKIPITTEEIQKMLKCTKSLRTIAIIHFLASTGVRPGALVDPILKMKHLVRMNDCYAIKVYDESMEGYWSFLTPEATKALDDYIQWRKVKNETITDDSPIFGIIDKRNAKGEHLTEKNLRYIIGLLILNSGIQRTKVNNHRYDKAIVYMFRKRFNGKLKMENSVNSNIAEKLMAHKKGLDGVYLEPTREECFKEFVKAMPELTIDPTERQRLEIEIITKEKSELKIQIQKSKLLEEKSTSLEERIEQLEAEKGGILSRSNLVSIPMDQLDERIQKAIKENLVKSAQVIEIE